MPSTATTSLPAESRLDILRCRSYRQIKQRLPQALEAYAQVLPVDRQAPVLLKPNLNANMNALTGNTTDLRLISVLLGWLKDRGYVNLTVGEGTNSGFYRSNISVITRLKVDELCRHFGARVLDLNYDRPYLVDFSQGVKAEVSWEAVQAMRQGLLINLPKLKTHFEMTMSACLKNLMGCLVGQVNKKKTHLDLAANILMLNQALRPHLHIVDALVAMEGLGPTRGTPRRLDTLLLGRDPLLLDLACAKLAGLAPHAIPTLRLAREQGLITDEHQAALQGLDLGPGVRPFAPPRANPLAAFIHSPKRQRYFQALRNTRLFTRLAATQWFGGLLFKTGLRQDVFSQEEMDCQGLSLDQKACDGCGACADFCPLGLDLPAELEAAQGRCLRCLYCYAVCPRRAIAFHGQKGFYAEQERQYDQLIRACCGAAAPGALRPEGGDKPRPDQN